MLAWLVLAFFFSLTSLTNWTETEQVLRSGINKGFFSGAVLAVINANSTLYKKAVGTVGPKRGLWSPLMTEDLHFDLGYLTAPIALNIAFM